MHERGIVALKEQPEQQGVYTEMEQPLDRSGELPELAVELRNLTETQSGLENSLVGGFQAIVDQFGARGVVDALSRHDVASMVEVIDVLAPNSDEKQKLFDMMRAVSLDVTFAELNDKAGGSQNFDALDQAERFRDVEVASLEDGTPTTSTDYFMTGFYHVAIAHPELIEDFVKTNDTVALLGGMRKTQRETYSDFVQIGNEVIKDAATEQQRALGEITAAQDQIEAHYAETVGRLEASLEDARTQGNQYKIDSTGIALMYQQHSLEQNRAQFDAQRAEVNAHLHDKQAQLDQLQVSPPVELHPMTNQEGLVLEMRDGRPAGRAIDSYAT